MNNINVNLENLTDKERDTLLSLIKKANNDGERWKPEDGGIYYYVDSAGMIKSDMWKDGYTHLCRYELGNVFRAGKDADSAGCKIHYTTKLEDFARKHNGEFRGCKFYLAANKTEDGLYYVEIEPQYENIISRYAREYPMPSFSSRDVALKVIEEIGEPNLLKYYFQVI